MLLAFHGFVVVVVLQLGCLVDLGAWLEQKALAVLVAIHSLMGLGEVSDGHLVLVLGGVSVALLYGLQ